MTVLAVGAVPGVHVVPLSVPGQNSIAIMSPATTENEFILSEQMVPVVIVHVKA